MVSAVGTRRTFVRVLLEIDEVHVAAVVQMELFVYLYRDFFKDGLKKDGGVPTAGQTSGRVGGASNEGFIRPRHTLWALQAIWIQEDNAG